MRKLITILVVLLLVGCARVTVTKQGDDFEVATWTVFKNVEQVQGEKKEGEVNFSLGASTSSEEASALFLVCTINPSLPICEG